MNKHSTEILIMTRSIVLQQGLGALLESLPGIPSVKAIKELSAAYDWIEFHQPSIVLLDNALSETNVRFVLEKIQVLSRGTQRILLVDHAEEVRWLPKYAEAVLVKGESASAIATIVTNLLFSEGDGHGSEK